MATKEVIERLGNVPIFSGCTKKELTTIARVARQIDHPKGSVIAAEGEPGAGLFVIDTGGADITIGGARVNHLGPGDFFGEMALLDGGPRTATVTATADTSLFAISGWVFRGLVTEHPGIGMRMLETMAGRLREASARP